MNIEHSTNLIQDLFKIPFNFIFYVYELILKKQDISSTNINALLHIGYFVISIFALEFFVNFYYELNNNSLEINVLKFINKPYVFLFYISIAIPIAIIFSILTYIFTFFHSIFYHYLIIFSSFIQIIKFYSIVNIIITIFMIIGIKEIMVNQLNLLNEVDFKLFIKQTSIVNITVLIISFGLLLKALHNIIIKPLFNLLKINFPIFISVTCTVIILYLTFKINLLAYNNLTIYPTIKTSNMINHKEFCLQILNYNIDNNATIRNELDFIKYREMILECKKRLNEKF